MNKDVSLKECFEEAIRVGAKYIYTEIFIEGYPSSEIIINPIDNAELKIEFFASAYDEDLKNKRTPHISVLSYGYCDDLGELEYVHHTETH